MADTIDVVASGKMLEVRVSGKLTKEAYDKLVPVVDCADQGIRQAANPDDHGRLPRLDDGALWEDTKFDLKHWRDIERLAIVGETKWEEGMATFCKPFTTAKIKYFDHTKLDDARKWIAD